MWGDMSGELFREMVEHLPDAISCFDAVHDPATHQVVDFRWGFANAAALETIGCGKLEGRTLREVFPDLAVMDSFRRVVETGAPFEERGRWSNLIWGDGNRRARAFDLRAMKLHGRLVVIARDVTVKCTSSEQVTQQGVELAGSVGQVVTLNELAAKLNGSNTVEEVVAVALAACKILFPAGGSLTTGGSPRSWGLNAAPSLCALSVTLDARGERLGELELYAPLGKSLGEPLIELARHAGELVSLTLANLKLRDELRTLSVRDPLTGAFNRRYMEETFVRELARVRRAGGTLGLIQIDIDEFKRFNDTHGHPAGDSVMRAVALTLAAAVRSSDVVCRYGGEEFTILMPDASVAVAEARAMALRERIAALQVRHGPLALPPVTISCGVAAMPEHGDTPEALLGAADDALYAAKRAGRNRVVIALAS
jgi:diguanylate cyclase (GGDEF)-like protein